MSPRIILIHGNSGEDCSRNWFPYVKRELEGVVEVVARDFPDSQLARESIWIPFLRNELKADENTILVGHSSGAIAAMRYAETTPILGSILVGLYHSDLGMESEKASGYFDRPWNWEAIRKNQQWIAMFASTDDPWIPIVEPRFIAEQLGGDYYEFDDQGHFGADYDKKEFPELVEVLRGHL